jgi:hypothetical protein
MTTDERSPREWWINEKHGNAYDNKVNDSLTHLIEYSAFHRVCNERNLIARENKTLRAAAEKLAQDFERHLSTMQDVNSHLGYPMSQPLIVASQNLAEYRAKFGGKGE